MTLVALFHQTLFSSRRVARRRQSGNGVFTAGNLQARFPLSKRLQSKGFLILCGLALGFAAAWMSGGHVQPARIGEHHGSNASSSSGVAAHPAMPVHALPPRDWRNLRRIRLAGPYPAQVLHVIDGDTFVARVPVWLGHDIVTRIRLRSIDTPELRGHCRQEIDKAREAKQVLEEFLTSGRVQLQDIGTGKYAGRVIARAFVTAPKESIAQDAGAMLLAGGYARPYTGGRRRGWCGVRE